MARTTFGSPSNFANYVQAFSLNLAKLTLRASGATTGVEAQMIVTEPGQLSRVAVRVANPGASGTTDSTVVLRKTPNGSNTPLVIATAPYPAATTPDLMTLFYGPASATSVALLSVEPGDIVALRFTAAASGATTTYGPVTASVDLLREFE